MGSDYLAISNDQGDTLAVVDFSRGRDNPVISFARTISLWDVKGVLWQIEQYQKNPW